MSNSDWDWLTLGEGRGPTVSWSFRLEAPLADFAFAREAGDVFAADQLGGVYRLNREGRLGCLSRSYKGLRRLSLSDTGTFGAGVLGDDELIAFDSTLTVRWSKPMPAKIQAVQVDPFGHLIAVAMDQHRTEILDFRKRHVAEFSSVRPLHYLRFLAERRELIGAADYGVLLRYDFTEEPLWEEKMLGGVGDLSLPGDGELIYLAGFNHGVQVFTSEGENHAAYVIKGTPSVLSTTYDGRMVIVGTQENFLYRMTPRGDMVWAAEAPEPIAKLQCDPLGDGFLCGFASGRIARLDWRR